MSSHHGRFRQAIQRPARWFAAFRRPTDSYRESSRVGLVHLLGRLLSCLFDGSFKIVRIDVLAECCKLGVDVAVRLAALFGVSEQLLQSERGDRRIVIEIAEMGAAGLFDELALVGVDSRFIEEPLDFGVKLGWKLDADTRVSRGNTIVLQKHKMTRSD